MSELPLASRVQRPKHLLFRRADAKEVPEMKQTQIVRRARRHGGPGEPNVDLPVTPASDTSAAARVLAAIDAAIAS
jgi:hypothetical protein